MIQQCKAHGETEHSLRHGRKNSYFCKKCHSEIQRRRRIRFKETLVKEFGGACKACGYDRCLAALHFHHKDPDTKSFNVNYSGAKNLESLRKEAQKCDLLCANCHAEVENQATIV